jgi:hypothetical protein
MSDENQQQTVVDDASGAQPAPQEPAEEGTREGQEGAQQAVQPNGEQGTERRNTTPKWVQHRIDELTRARREAERAAEAREARIRELEARLGGNVPGPAAPATTVDVESEVQARLAAQRFNDRCNQVHAEAVKADPQFDSSYRQLIDAVGPLPTQFLEQVVEQPDAAAILSQLTSDYDETARILALSPLAQGRELERLAAKLNATPKPPAVSNAPAPARPADTGGTSGTGSSDWDKMPLDEFMRKRNASSRRRS